MNKKISIISFVLVLIFIGLAFALTSPAVISPTSGQNVSGSLLLNATIAANNVTNVTFYFYNSTSGVLIYNTTIVNDTVDDIEFNYTLDTTTVSDGIYNLTVNATNSTGDTTTNTSVTEVTIDNTVPAVSAFTNPTDGTYYSNSTSTVLLNVSITDATIGIDTVLFQISNGTNAFNLTASNVSSYWNATLNFTLLSVAEANHTITIFANDTLNNLNNSITVNIVYDNTIPVINNLSAVALSTTTGNLTVNATDATADIANCTYLTIPGSVSGTLSGSNPYNATISGLSAGTAYTVNVTCTDNAGNTQTNTTASFTTTAAAVAATTTTTTTSSGSGGGSATSQVAGQFAKEIWETIDAGESITVSVDNGEIGVTEVRFEASKKLYGMWMKVEKKDSLPSKIKDLELKTYKYFEITKSLVLKGGTFKILKLTLRFLNLG